MKNKTNSFNYLILVITIVMLLFTTGKILYLASNIISISVITNSFNEVRDFVSYRLTHYILENENPYSLDFPSKTNPPFLLLYTALNPLLSAVICRFTGIGITASYYVGNIILYLLTAGNMWFISRNLIKNKITAFLCVMINTATFFSLFGLPVFNFHTDTIGIYITSIILIILRKNKKQTVLLSVFTIILIFTKQILIIIALSIFLYFLISKEKKLAFRYLLQCILLGLITFIVVQWLFPLYWTETIYAQFFVSQNYGNIYESIHNILYFYYQYFMDVILIIAGILAGFNLDRKKKKSFSFSDYVTESVKHHEYAIFLIINLIIGSFSLLYFAKCESDGYKYCQDILAPSLFLLTIYVWFHYFGHHFSEGNSRNIRCIILSAIFACAAVINYSHFETNYYTKDDVKDLFRLDEEIAAFRGERIYLGMNSTQFILNHDLFDDENIDFNDGQIQYFNGNYPNVGILDRLFYKDVIERAAKTYVSSVNQRVKNKEYSLITTCIDQVINHELLSENYYTYQSYKIKTDTNGIFTVTLWLPK